MNKPEFLSRDAMVILSLDASSTANDVGREIAEMMGMRALAAFCTSS
jgi:hypothetical protein